MTDSNTVDYDEQPVNDSFLNLVEDILDEFHLSLNYMQQQF
jgi:hypothetical protein